MNVKISSLLLFLLFSLDTAYSQQSALTFNCTACSCSCIGLSCTCYSVSGVATTTTTGGGWATTTTTTTLVGATSTTTTTRIMTTTTLPQLGQLVFDSFSPASFSMYSGEQTLTVTGRNFPLDRNFQVWLFFGVNSSVSGGDDRYVTVLSPVHGTATIPANYLTWEALNGLPQDPVNGDYMVGMYLYYNLDPIHQRSDPLWFRIKAGAARDKNYMPIIIR